MPKLNFDAATDWTQLLGDPDLSKNLGKLLQTYRDASPESRDQALLAAMREIKKEAQESNTPGRPMVPSNTPVPATASSIPPYEPDIFSPNAGADRRSSPRIRCFVAVELRVNDAEKPIWGNLSNTSLGGCQVETSEQISGGSKVEMGLWVASGKIWVKGMALNGVVSKSATGAGVRVRFAGMDAAGKDNLRQFLKYIQEATRASQSESKYLQMLR